MIHLEIKYKNIENKFNIDSNMVIIKSDIISYEVYSPFTNGYTYITDQMRNLEEIHIEIK